MAKSIESIRKNVPVKPYPIGTGLHLRRRVVEDPTSEGNPEVRRLRGDGTIHPDFVHGERGDTVRVTAVVDGDHIEVSLPRSPVRVVVSVADVESLFVDPAKTRIWCGTLTALVDDDLLDLGHAILETGIIIRSCEQLKGRVFVDFIGASELENFLTAVFADDADDSEYSLLERAVESMCSGGDRGPTDWRYSVETEHIDCSEPDSPPDTVWRRILLRPSVSFPLSDKEAVLRRLKRGLFRYPPPPVPPPALVSP